MNPLTLLIATILLGSMAERALSQTLEWGSAAFSDLSDSEGNELDSSFVFELGAFDVGFDPTAYNVDDWFANWNVFDTASYNAGNGVFTGTEQVQNVTNYESLFEGLNAYIWVRNDTVSGADTEWFLGRKSTGLNAWVFPDLDPGCCPNGEVIQWSITALGAETPVWGNQTGTPGGGDYPDNGIYDLQTHAVPEPASAMLVLLGACVCFFRRRRSA